MSLLTDLYDTLLEHQQRGGMIPNVVLEELLHRIASTSELAGHLGFTEPVIPGPLVLRVRHDFDYEVTLSRVAALIPHLVDADGGVLVIPVPPEADS